MNMKNMAAVIRQYFKLLKGAAKKNADFLGGRRAVTVTHEKASMGMSINPMIRTDQPNPNEVLFSIFESAIGITTPPIEDPATTAPRAAARFLSKY
jgi:hypothetical protein